VIASTSGDVGPGPRASPLERVAQRWIRGPHANRIVLKARSHGTALANAEVDVVSSKMAPATPPAAPTIA